jgi:hypothetical protein
MGMIIGGLNRIRDLIDTDIDKGEIGTGTALETRDDTALVAAIASTEKTVTATTTSKQLVEKYQLLPTEANGNDVAELGLKNSGSAALWSRVTFDPFSKSSDFTFTFKTRWNIRERNR